MSNVDSEYLPWHHAATDNNSKMFALKNSGLWWVIVIMPSLFSIISLVTVANFKIEALSLLTKKRQYNDENDRCQ